MSPTETESNGRMTGASRYVEVNYNPTEIIPDAQPGVYNVVIAKVTVKPHPEYGYPQLRFTHTIESEESGIEANEQFIGADVGKSFTLYPDRRGNMGKEDLQRLCKATGIAISSFPGQIRNPEVDLRDFMDSFKGQRLQIWVTHRELPSREDPNVMTTFVNVDYEEPKNFAAQIGQAEEAVEEEPEPAPRRPAPKPAAKPAKKGASARR